MRSPDATSSDTLTGVLSRIEFQHQTKRKVEENSIDNLFLAAIEISRFGNVNAGMGNELGDKILKLVAKRLSLTFSDALLIGRMHGDHFGLLFEHADQQIDTIDRLLDFVQRPIAVSGQIIVLGIRIGVSSLQQGAMNAIELLNGAEIALHRSKVLQHKVTYYDPKMVMDAKSQHNLENDLRVALTVNATELHKALYSKEFVLHYQPVIDAVEHQMVGAEALIRWQHNKRGLVPPANFIPVAESIHVIEVLGAWVLRRACADAMTWPLLANQQRLFVSVNISPVQIMQPDFLLATIKIALADSGLPPECLKLEITESESVTDIMLETLHKVRRLGCKICLDDFGTGYSSLTELQKMPLDYLKIDRSFIHDIISQDAETSAKAMELVRLVFSIASILHINTIVEGIEHASQRTLLLQAGARLMQGFAFSHPLDVTEFISIIPNRFCLGE